MTFRRPIRRSFFGLLAASVASSICALAGLASLALGACSLTSDLGALECGAACDPDAQAQRIDATASDATPPQDSASAEDTGSTPAEASTDDGGKSAGIRCGVAGTCDPATDVCCATPFIASCSSPASCKGTPIPCDGPSDCASGQICCGTVSGPALDSVACSASCTGSDHVVFCDPADPVCAAGSTCKTAHFASDLLGNLVSAYSTCQ